jgi:hypothetical protein
VNSLVDRDGNGSRPSLKGVKISARQAKRPALYARVKTGKPSRFAYIAYLKAHPVGWERSCWRIQAGLQEKDDITTDAGC